ncbi:MAG: DUF1566 domain-containing protein [Dissulfurispiraceae bacterium]
MVVTSFPNGAQVWIDGVNTENITPATISLPAGTTSIDVVVEAPGNGWVPFENSTFTISPGTNNLYVTLNPVPPSWDQTIPGQQRFIVLANMNNEAVLDKETGLVWEQSLSTTVSTWEGAQSYCNNLTKGNRLGWRLPTIQELASLVDPSVTIGPTLPSGHPFSTMPWFNYCWSATTNALDTTLAWIVNFIEGTTDNVAAKNNVNGAYVWCVRGGKGVDPQ